MKMGTRLCSVAALAVFGLFSVSFDASDMLSSINWTGAGVIHNSSSSGASAADIAREGVLSSTVDHNESSIQHQDAGQPGAAATTPVGGEHTAAASNDTVQPADKRQRSNILPRAVDLWRRNVSLAEEYGFPPLDPTDPECSCQNANTTERCCLRIMARAHKMGYTMNKELLEAFSRPPSSRIWSQITTVDFDYFPLIRGNRMGRTGGGGGGTDGGNNDQHRRRTRVLPPPPPAADFRAVLVLRNVYASIVSGYLVRDGDHTAVLCLQLSCFRLECNGD